MNSEADTALAHHRRDAKVAATVHVLLIALLIVLWLSNLRLDVLGRVQAALLRTIFR